MTTYLESIERYSWDTCTEDAGTTETVKISDGAVMTFDATGKQIYPPKRGKHSKGWQRKKGKK